MRLGVLLAVLVGGCAATPLQIAVEPDCNWTVDVGAPAIHATGDDCIIRSLAEPMHVALEIRFAGGHALDLDTQDPIPGDPYGRVRPPVEIDGRYVPCGAAATGEIVVNISAGHWSVDVDNTECAQSVRAHFDGRFFKSLPVGQSAAAHPAPGSV